MNKFYVIRLWACLLFSTYSFGQTPVNTFSTVTNAVVPGGTYSQTIQSHANSVNGIQANTNYDVSYNNNGNVRIVDFTVGGNSYVRFGIFDTVIIRRVANTWETTGGNKQHIYCQGPALVDNLFHNMPFPAAYPQVAGYNYMERVMEEGFINRGSDNVFNNDPNSDQTANNIERVDFVYKNGMSTLHTTMAGFLVAERGGNDPFKIAAITGVDANGNPTSYGPVVSVATSAYGNSIMSLSTYVMRKDANDNLLRPFSLVALQNIRSTFISFSHLGVSTLQRIYGYSLMANDVTATTSAQVLNFTNSTYYPRTTTATNGGMDIASAPGIYHTNLVLSGHYLDLKVISKDCEPELQWNDGIANTAGRQYTVERSYDGEKFEAIGQVPANVQASYNFTDRTNYQALAYYRIHVKSGTGATYHSSVVFVTKECSSEKVTLYPNPAKDQLTISLGYKATSVTLFALNGKASGEWQLNGNERQFQLNLSHLPAGQYYVRIKDADGRYRTFPVVKQ